MIKQIMSTLTITTIQSTLHWENKKANLSMFAEKIKGISEKTELVILPEMFSTGFTMEAEKFAEPMDGESVNWMREMAAMKKVILMGSLIISDSEPAAGGMRYYNRLIWMLPNGEYGIYDKRHLFAYAGEDKNFTPGSRRLIASVKGWKINLIVCYDLRFPVWARQSIKDESLEYDALICVANWPNRRAQAWRTLLQARAIENQSFVVGVNRVGQDGNGHQYAGDSMVIDPLGEILYHKENIEDVFTITLNKEKLTEVRSKLPFWKDADPFIISE